MNFWAEIVGQPDAVQILERAAGDERELSHAWLITGPPGSGRSNIALRFAAALVARTEAERPQVFSQVSARTHPDVTVVATDKVVIGIEDVRDVVTSAYFSPSVGRHRVIVIEDADRMAERTSNVLLKALEEPPERTIWVLCAPSEADLLPTIRSRARSLRLVTPAPTEIAALLHVRDGIELAVAERAARLAQSHIGMAKRLATDAEAMSRRELTITRALDVSTLGGAMRAAAALLKIAEADAAAYTAQRESTERSDAMRNLGLEPGATVPPQLRTAIKALEEDQKRRATRSLRDGIDRILTDLLSLYRDVLVTALKAGVPLVNQEQSLQITELANAWQADRSLLAVEAIERARERLRRGVTPGLTLEAMFAAIVGRGATERVSVTRGARA